MRFPLDELDRFFDRVQAGQAARPALEMPERGASALATMELPAEAADAIGSYLEVARLLGQRTAELHLNLGSDPRTEAFRPEEFTQLYQRSIYQSFRSQTARALGLLRRKLGGLSVPARQEANRILESEQAINARFRAVVGGKIRAMRIRLHGAYHLGQVLHTGKDFVIIDFEGEPERPISERRIKRSPLRDVAGMLRSFDHAAHTALLRRVSGADAAAPEFQALEPWARVWTQGVSGAFLRAYLETMRRSSLLPSDARELDVLMDAFLLEKALSELGYELNHRPDRVRVPMQGVLHLLERPPAARN